MNLQVIGLDDVIDFDFLQPSSFGFDRSPESAVSNIRDSLPIGLPALAWTDIGIGVDSFMSYDLDEHPPPKGGLDLGAAWASASALLQREGEDVGALLLRAGERVDAWHAVAGVHHLIAGPFGHDDVRKAVN